MQDPVFTYFLFGLAWAVLGMRWCYQNGWKAGRRALIDEQTAERLAESRRRAMLAAQRRTHRA